MLSVDATDPVGGGTRTCSRSCGAGPCRCTVGCPWARMTRDDQPGSDPVQEGLGPTDWPQQVSSGSLLDEEPTDGCLDVLTSPGTFHPHMGGGQGGLWSTEGQAVA